MKKIMDKLKLSTRAELIIYTTSLLLVPLLTLIMIESVHRRSVVLTFDWMVGNIFSFLATYLFLLFLIGIFYFLPRKLFISSLFIQFFVWIAIAFASYKKHQLRGDYITPFDMHLLREAVNITEYLGSLITGKMIVLIVFSIIGSVIGMLCFLQLRIKIPFAKRLTISAVSIVTFILLINNPVVFSMKVEESNEVNEMYESIGFTGAFLKMRDQSNNYGPPKDYKETRINGIIKDVNTSNYNTEVDPEFQPNVIVVLAEALWDPLLLEGIEFEEDPIPYFRSLTKEYSSGYLLTHIFSGGTINTELEVLTGLTTRFLPEGQETYAHNIDKPIDSLAHVFREQGYNTTAVHAFANWFYKRNEKYKWLGFEKFVSREFFNDPKHIGLYIDDHELMAQVLQELKKSEGSDFMQVNTVASHGPYEDTRYEKLPEITKGDVSKKTKSILNLYSQLLMELDDSIKMLIEGIEELNEPTMVVVYGDHLPMLGEDYLAYKEAGYYEGDKSFEEYKKMYETPLLVWDNYSNQEREDLKMTPNFLGSYILSHAKKEKSTIFETTGNLYRQGIKQIPRKEFWKEVGLDDELLESYKLLQYDSLFGYQIQRKVNPVNVVESYFLGSERMKIESVTIETLNNGENILEIIGEDFVFDAKVFIDGKEQDTIFVSSSIIQSEIPRIYASQDKEFTISIRVTDNIDVVLSSVDFTVSP